MTLKRLRAFTLIELLIVITIIGILAVALVPRISGGPAKARDAARKADLQSIATGLEFYADDNGGKYPGTASAAECLASTFATPTTHTALKSYMNSVPADPTTTNVTTDGVMTSACTGSYYYVPNSALTGYVLMANLENNKAYGAGKGLYNLQTAEPASVSALTSECTLSTTCTDVYYAMGR